MDPFSASILLAGFLVFLYVVYRRNELFLLSIREGRVIVVRGRVPPGFLDDVRTIVKGVRSATIRVAKDDDHARLTASGVDERVLQRLRNAFSTYPSSRLRSAPPIERPTLGQVLGIAWLAWLLERRA